jgi:alginate O-acetyltransferase complex protein AlgI
LRFDELFFLLQFLPGLLALYYLVALAGATYRRGPGGGNRGLTIVLLSASFFFVARSPAGWILIGCALITFVLATSIERARDGGSGTVLRNGLVAMAVAVNAATLVLVRLAVGPRSLACGGAAILTCHAIALVLDVSRGQASVHRPLSALLYLVQFPVLPAGPLVRYPDFIRQASGLDHGLSVGAFAYGTRRLVVGLFKVMAIADTLAVPADAIFALPPSDLHADVAWFGTACFSLQLYFAFSGYADMGIGLGKMLGLRYPENFRRPYVADSVREFWRRWNVTAMIWLRDYLLPPAAEHGSLFLRLIAYAAGFVLIGLWHGAGWTLGVWAAYSSAWLALEAAGLGERIARWPAPLRHAYLLAVVVVGWAILRADTVGGAWAMLQAMAGASGLSGPGALVPRLHMTAPVAAAFVTAIVGAGPLIPWLSRWRVSVDATTAALVMMISAVSLFLWRLSTLTRNDTPARRPPTRR